MEKKRLATHIKKIYRSEIRVCLGSDIIGVTMLPLTMLLTSASGDCSVHVDPLGCRSNSDFANVAMEDMTLSEQIAFCGKLCCSYPQCTGWAVREAYDAGWAGNCTKNKNGTNCCLLKHKGWVMHSSIKGCTSGGPSVAPTPPPPPPPPPPTPPSPPLPRGGGACMTDYDCSFGGQCISHVCACDVQFTGPLCGVVSLRRATLDNGMQMNGTHTWGGARA